MDIADRIAAVLSKHDCYDYAGGLECRCGESFIGDDNNAEVFWARHAADVLVAELELKGDKRMSDKDREVDPKDFEHITYRGVGLAAYTPNPKIKWHPRQRRLSACEQAEDYPLSQTAAGHKLTLRACVRNGRPIEAFDAFIKAWVDPKWHAHLLDNDNNDGEWVRDAIRDVMPRLT